MTRKTTPTRAERNITQDKRKILHLVSPIAEECEECGYFYDDNNPCECDCEEEDND